MMDSVSIIVVVSGGETGKLKSFGGPCVQTPLGRAKFLFS